jgi:uncharacterized protein with ATP-grasp and redox domains
VLDRAGEASIDLLVIGVLSRWGHNVKVAANALPALDRETAAEFHVLPGTDFCGIDLNCAPPALVGLLTWADLIVLKGEDNFLGLPPEYGYRANILYLATVKHLVFFRGVREQLGLRRDPRRGEGILWFKPAAQP